MSKFNDSYKEYYRIIEEARMLGRSKLDLDQYFEEHHIIPSSLGGSNKKSNLVLLTPEEHYICHSLLLDFCDGESYYMMTYAWNMLNNFAKFSGILLLGSKQYGECKRRYILSITGSNHHNAKLVYQLDKKTGTILDIFGSVSEASKMTGAFRSNISTCALSNIFRSTMGNCWAYEETLDKVRQIIINKPNHHLAKKVYQLDKEDGEIIDIWVNVSEVVSKLNAKSIRNLVLCPSYGTAKNFCWSYEENLEETILKIKERRASES